MICKYCELIHSVDEMYPLRDACFDLKSDFPRCEWHWRYVCDVCGKPRHFNGITWCEKSEKFICIFCGEDHRFIEEAFWRWKGYYVIRCSRCNERHPALDRSEYGGNHPWQVHPKLHREKWGMSAEQEILLVYSSRHFLSKDFDVSDSMVGEAWDRFADEWDKRYTDLGDRNRQYIIDPAILDILGRVEDKRILDAGCGNGYLCRLLSTKGAKSTGVDVSKRFIEIAEQREKQKPLNIQYHVGSLCELSMFADETFDAIVSNIVLSDLQNLNQAFQELNRVLIKGGKLVFSIMHPCFSSTAIKGWVKKPVDSNRREDWLYWKVDRYFERSVEEWRMYDFSPVYGFHRPLSEYITLLISNGFTITDFEEPAPTKEDINEHYRGLNDADRIPWFLVVGAKKAS